MLALRQSKWGPDDGSLQPLDVAVPRPEFGEVLVRVVAAGVNPVDHYTRLGLAYNRVLELPFVHGWDVAGVVEEVAYGVTRFAPGDRVFGMPRFPHQAGTFAERLTSPSRHLAHLPDGMGFAQAAALPLAGLTAWQMLVEVADVAPGQRVLVAGAAGGVGHLAVQIAKARGAHVIGTAGPGRQEFVRQLGADEVVDRSTTDVSRVVRDVDVVIQMFGGPDGLRALECLRPGGILVSGQAAWTPGLQERAAELGVRASDFLVEPDAAGLEALARLVEKGELVVRVAREYPLPEAAAAVDEVALGRTAGKIVIIVDEEGAR